MRVLFVTHYNAMLGANKSMLQLIMELKEYGVEPTVMMPISIRKSDLSEELEKKHIQYLQAPIKKIKHPNFWKVVINYFLSISLRKKVYNLIKDQHYDIIHSNSSIIDIGCYLSKKLGSKHCWHLREFGDLDYNFKTPFGKWYQKIIYSGDNNFIAISNAISRHYSRFIKKNRIHIIYNGVKPYKNKEIHDWNKKGINFCIVGLIHRNKRQMDVIKALYDLIKVRNISDCHLYIIGSGDEVYKQELLEYLKETNLTSYVTFMGQVNNVPELLEKMDVGIMASSNEAFGRVTIEYMLAGLCVIASKTGANSEIITHNETGFLYPLNDNKKLADYMELCVKDQDKVAKISKNGYEHARLNFSSTKNSEKIYSLYTKTLKR